MLNFDSHLFSEHKYKYIRNSFLVSGMQDLVILKLELLCMSACTEDVWKKVFPGLFIPSRFLAIWHRSVPACGASSLWGKKELDSAKSPCWEINGDQTRAGLPQGICGAALPSWQHLGASFPCPGLARSVWAELPTWPSRNTKLVALWVSTALGRFWVRILMKHNREL